MTPDSHGMARRFVTRSLPLLLLGLILLPAQAEVRLHHLFTDHMVLQRDKAVPVWGWADDGEEVTVEFRGRTERTRARHGRWQVKLGKLHAGGPDDLKVTGRNQLVVHDVLVGEVWIASGQSNMEWPMRASDNPLPDIVGASNPQLRLFTVPKLKSLTPVNDVEASWQETGPTSVTNFSAVAYYFGRYLQNELRVPVGIIHTSWGGSPAEVWMSDRVLLGDRTYKREILDTHTEQMRGYTEAKAKFEEEQAEAKQAGRAFDKKAPDAPYWRPTELYNGMIAPLLPCAIQGAIWYQGESNADRAHQYRNLFADMIRNWRTDWDQGEFTFLLVQLAPFKEIKDQPAESTWAELREAQTLATQRLKNVGMAVITDVGDEKDIHPRWKRPVGERLGQAARHIAYGQEVLPSGPVFRKLAVKGHNAIVHFDNVGQGLFGGPRSDIRSRPVTTQQAALTYNLQTGTLETPLVGFSIAGADRKFVWADAKIVGDTVVVSSPQVPKPAAVRFGWADFPVVNLFGRPGPGLPPLPASPFRSDDWSMITAPKK